MDRATIRMSTAFCIGQAVFLRDRETRRVAVAEVVGLLPDRDGRGMLHIRLVTDVHSWFVDGGNPYLGKAGQILIVEEWRLERILE